MPTLTVVIPVYNESENILTTLGQLDAVAPPDTEVLVVHDTPEDTTLPVLGRFHGKNLRVAPLLNGLGPGAIRAIRQGLSSAQGEYVLVVMADCCDDLNILPAMIALGESGSQVICGSRFMRGGSHAGKPGLKKWLAQVAGLSLHYLAGLPTHDATNSFKLYSRKLLQTVRVESGGGFEVGLELVVKAWVCGFEVSELPASWTDRTAGTSRFRLVEWLPYYLRWYFLGMSYGLGLRLLNPIADAGRRKK